MTWLITESSFELVVGDDYPSLHGYTYRHEWLAYGEGLADAERERIAALPLKWEICPAQHGRLAHYAGHFGQKAGAASTAVAIPSDAIIVLAEVSERRWPTLLHAFETYTAATYPKHFRVNIPFESLSVRNERTIPLEQFLSGKIVNLSEEEASAVFYYGSELPEVTA